MFNKKTEFCQTFDGYAQLPDDFPCKWLNRLSSISVSSWHLHLHLKLTTFHFPLQASKTFQQPHVGTLLNLNWPSTNNKLYDTGMWEHFLWMLWAMLMEHMTDQMGLLSTSWMGHSLSSHMANDAVMRERNSHAPKWTCFRSRGTSVGVFQLFVAKMTGPAYIHTLYYYSYSLITV